MKNTKASVGSPALLTTLGTDIAVTSDAPECFEQARQLGAKLNIPLIASDAPGPGDLVLHVTPKGLLLTPTDRRLGGPIAVDFVRGAVAQRRMTAGFTRQPLAKALGLKAGRPSVIDATAGLGRDAFQIASLGCTILAIERSPVLFAMLNDALDHARRKNDPKLTDVIDRIEVMEADAKTVLESIKDDQRPDVVYLDPMYTPRTSSALAKKEMRILRMLVGSDEDAAELLEIARKAATRRVVIKRHLRARPLADGVSQFYPGRTVRYDVYPGESSS